jgi:hypothetical protein
MSLDRQPTKRAVLGCHGSRCARKLETLHMVTLVRGLFYCPPPVEVRR